MSRPRPVTVSSLEAGGVAERAGVRVGDRVVGIDGEPLADSLDFELFASEATIELEIERDGTAWEVRLEREFGEGLGMTVSHPPRLCRLKCRFCFVGQQPRGLRRSLCLRDDDPALSFIDGNYVTLSNVDAGDVERLTELGLSPLYVSVHATDPDVRQRLLRPLNRLGLDVLPALRGLVEAGLEVHTQIVLVPGYNDGPHLERTLDDLAPLVPAVRSIAVVPVGLTRFQRDATLRAWRADEAAPLLAQLAPWQTRFERDHGVPVVVASDEWYLLAERDPPPAETYDGFPQIENGVGLVRQMLDELPARPSRTVKRIRETVAVATGQLAAPVLRRALAALGRGDVRVLPVTSAFWGPSVTVAGLLTASDLAAALAEESADRVLLPDVVLNEDGLFLDGPDLEWLQARVAPRLQVVSPTAAGLHGALRSAR